MRVRINRFLAAVTGGAIAFPVGALLHELGHFVAFRMLGFSDAVLRYSSVSVPSLGGFRRLMREGNLEAALEIAQPWQVTVGTSAGLFVSYLTVLFCVLAVRRFGPNPLVLGIGLISPIRFLVAIPYFALALVGRQVVPGTDEAIVALTTGIPLSLLYLPGLACLGFGYWFLFRAIPSGQRLQTVIPTSLGLVLGGLLWAFLLGPLLLP